MQPDSLNVIHARAAGLDVHKMQITATVRVARSGQDAETFTEVFGALPSGLAALCRWLDGHRVSAAVMEATGVYWETVFDALDSTGIEALAVHAQHVKQIKGRKTDVADSVWLARICQFGLCRASFVPNMQFRDLRKLSRQRRKAVQLRSVLRTRVHRILDSAGVRVGGVLSDLFGVNGQRIPKGLAEGRPREDILASLSHHVRARAELLCDALGAHLSEQARRRIAAHDARIRQSLQPYRDRIDRLCTVPGIDEASACAILIELGPDMGVFPSVQQCAAWAGLCPGNNQSAGKKRPGNTRKGNTFLRTLLIECAHGAARTRDCQFNGYHKSLTARRGYKRATVATAHKLLRTVYYMLRNGEVYRDPDTDYEKLMVMRNAPRWIRRLKKHGVDPTAGPAASPRAA